MQPQLQRGFVELAKKRNHRHNPTGWGQQWFAQILGLHFMGKIIPKKPSLGLGILSSPCGNTAALGTKISSNATSCPPFLCPGAHLALSHPPGKSNPKELLSHLPALWMLPVGCNHLRDEVRVFIRAHCSPEPHPEPFQHFIFKDAAPQPCSKHIPAFPAPPYCLFWKEICYQLSIAVASI